jgi:hypothetical protein
MLTSVNVNSATIGRVFQVRKRAISNELLHERAFLSEEKNMSKVCRQMSEREMMESKSIVKGLMKASQVSFCVIKLERIKMTSDGEIDTNIRSVNNG